MGAEIQVDNFTITNQVECMRWRARKTIWKYTLEMRWAKYKYKHTLEMRWRPNGEEEVGGLGRLGEWGQLTISEGGL